MCKYRYMERSVCVNEEEDSVCVVVQEWCSGCSVKRGGSSSVVHAWWPGVVVAYAAEDAQVVNAGRVAPQCV